MASTEIHEFESLLFDWEDGILDATGIARLRDLLRTNPEVRRLYVQRQMFGAIFKLDGDAGISSPDLEHSGATVANVSATDIEHFLPSTVLHDAVDAHAVVQRAEGPKQRRHRSLLFAVAASILFCVLL